MTAIASMVGTTAKAIPNATPTTMVGRKADVIVESTVAQLCRRVQHDDVVGGGGSDGGRSDVVDARREAATARQHRREMPRDGKGRRHQRLW